MSNVNTMPADDVNDSLMEFIQEYFRGDVSTFSMCDGISAEEEPNLGAYDEPSPSMFDDGSTKELEFNSNRAFDDSSSEENTMTQELFSSPDNSILNSSVVPADAQAINLSFSSPATLERSLRRKSISYEIRFTNLKESNGKVKIQIVPNQETSSVVASNSPTCENSRNSRKAEESCSLEEKLSLENSSLRRTVQVLEKKLLSLEKESEKVVGELKKIIEKKNEAISKLELKIAGIDFMDQE